MKVGSVNKSLKRAVAVSAVCAAGLAGTLSTSTNAVAGESSAKASSRADGSLTDFGMKALAFGTKVAVGGVDLKTLKDAKTIQACTRSAGLDRNAPSLLSTETITSLIGDAAGTDIGNLIKIDPSESKTETYRDGAITGTRAINTIANIAVGGDVIDNVSIPTIKIEGLQAIADSFYDPADTNADGKKFGTNESFGFKGISIDYSDTVVDGTPLAQLLDIVNQVAAPVNQVVSQLIDLLSSVGGVIKIPGLGSIGLGSSFHKIQDGFASSGANALQIEVNPSGQANGAAALLKLGYAQSRISSPVRSGVFRSTIMGLDFKALPLTDDLELLHMGGIGTQSIPCEGTAGKKVTKTIEGSRSIPLGLVDGVDLGIAKLTGLEYAYRAKQMSHGRAKSMSTSKLGSIEIPAFGLVIDGISSRLNLSSAPGQRVKGSNKPKFKVLSITQNGQSLMPAGGLKIGETLEFAADAVNQTGFITFGPRVSRNYYGAKLSALNVTIPGIVNLDLGWLESQIYPR